MNQLTFVAFPYVLIPVLVSCVWKVLGPTKLLFSIPRFLFRSLAAMVTQAERKFAPNFPDCKLLVGSPVFVVRVLCLPRPGQQLKVRLISCANRGPCGRGRPPSWPQIDQPTSFAYSKRVGIWRHGVPRQAIPLGFVHQRTALDLPGPGTGHCYGVSGHDWVEKFLGPSALY